MSTAGQKRDAGSSVEAEGDVMRLTPLGAGQEVGRSSLLLEFKGKSVLFDAGVHPAYTGLACLPFFDAIPDPGAVDVLLVTHFHLDRTQQQRRRTLVSLLFFSLSFSFSLF